MTQEHDLAGKDKSVSSTGGDKNGTGQKGADAATNQDKSATPAKEKVAATSSGSGK